MCLEHLRDPDSRETRDLSRPVSERKYSCQTDSESYSPELPVSVGNVSEITVAGLMGVNTVADGERPRPAQQKGVQYRGKILAALLWCTVSITELRVHINTVVRISKTQP